MKRNLENTNNFPVGYHKFNRKQVFNFQLNRWHSWGYTRFEDMVEAGKKINTFDDWKDEMIKLAEKALLEKRLINAAFYFRSAEFYSLQGDPDKKVFYDKFIELFYRAYEDGKFEKVEVPYKNSFLPALKVSPSKAIKGTIVMHGGFDSFMEEFYLMMKFFALKGYEVIAFEGPGQGGALKKYGIALDYEWEKPARAVLDHFKLDNVTWLGISMGGWFCFRAAAFEPRIKRVIASSIAFDYMKGMNIILRKMHEFFFNHFENFTNNMVMKSIENKKKGKELETWMISNLMHITKKKTPMEAFRFWLELNEKNLHSEMIKQDVLILTGRNDHFIPFKMHDMQIKALTNADSITARVFTKEEHADNHCQVGNIGLALDVMIDWINEMS